MQEDLFFDTKLSYSKVKKVPGHLSNEHAILEISLYCPKYFHYL